MASHTARTALAEEIARVVREVPGVAFLRPRLTGLLKPAVVPGPVGSGSATTAGVRLREDEAAGTWHVEVRLVALGGDRVLDVARAARRTVEERLDALLPGGAARAHVTVTVTGRV
ncbi:hypothetical protein [Streptomyces sp. bgisy060]|uniref:hypothetical protein n=1 Tax=Streptomyces sp. bgisy060 TaxID=3413775 RepID=UPI003EBEF433